ncbi:bifunctional DNA primase/polymerase [Candidatus Pacearchaeota archaeon]|nr:bifunctional DNA primase/polymerase [Candidatus Pacearchaeota archaeon]
MIEIPPQLRNLLFRFLAIEKPTPGDDSSGKKPIAGKSWKKQGKNANIHSFDSPFLSGWRRRDGNYGVITAYGGLIVFDADHLSRFKELGADFAKWPDTFQVRTGRANGEGVHYYFISEELHEKVVFTDPEHEDVQLGSLQAGTPDTPFYVVSPGSHHHSGGVYTVINDVPIATITKEQFWEVMNCIPHSKDKKRVVIRVKKSPKGKRDTPVDDDAYKNISSYIKCEDVAMPEPISRWIGATAKGEHPFHGSDNGENFHVDTKKNVWSCFRCHTGGSGLELVALKHGIIKCDEAVEGCLKGEKFWQAVEAALDDGHEIPDEVLEKYLPGSGQHDTTAEIVDSRIEVDELPDVLPDDKVDAVRGPPRIGKSHWSVKQLVKNGSGNYLTHRYSIIDHAIKIFRDLGGKGAVVVEGKGRPGMCRKNHDCTKCKLKPDESRKDEEGQMGFFQMQGIAVNLTHNIPVLTKNDVPDEYCPYYVLRFATEHAKYVFTVVNNIDNINIIKRDFTVIDEDPTLDYFFPGSPELAKVKMVYSEVHIINNLIHVMPAVESVILQIEEKKRKSAYDRVLLTVLEKVKDISIALNYMRDRNMSPKEVGESITKFVVRDHKERSHTEIIELLSALDNMYHSAEGEGDIDLRQVVTALLVPYTDRPVHWSNTGNGYRSMYLIGDARVPLMNMDWIYGSKKIVVIGATLAELFASKIDENPTVISIPKFKYARNYAVVPIDQDDQKDMKNIYRRQQSKLREVIKLIAGPADSKVDRPILVFSGSKSKQSYLAHEFGEKSHISMEGGEIAQEKNFRAGSINLAVLNAAVARGLDVDFYGVLALHDSSFAVPFWSAARHAGLEGAKEILESITSDEATNCALRIAPTMRSGRVSKPKIILVPRADLWKINYLGDKVIELKDPNGCPPSSVSVAKAIVDNNLTSRFLFQPNTTIEDLYIGSEWSDAVDSNRVDAVFRESVLENIDASPFDLDELYIDKLDAKILNILDRQRDSYAKRNTNAPEMDLKDLYKAVYPTVRYAMFRSRIQALRFSGKVKRRGDAKHPKYTTSA